MLTLGVVVVVISMSSYFQVFLLQFTSPPDTNELTPSHNSSSDQNFRACEPVCMLPWVRTTSLAYNGRT